MFRGCETTIAPASAASFFVASVLPSSITTTSVRTTPGNSRGIARMTDAMVISSFRAGMMTTRYIPFRGEPVC